MHHITSLFIGGKIFAVQSLSSQIHENLRFDFSSYVVGEDRKPDFKITHLSQDLPCPSGWAISTSRSRRFLKWKKKSVYFFHSTLFESTPDLKQAQITGTQLDGVYEVIYFWIQACFTTLADQTRQHRLHAAVIEISDRAVVIMGASGSGKSTLVGHVLGEGKRRILSEDTCQIDARTLHILPYFDRLSFHSTSPPAWGPTRAFHRYQYPTKLLKKASDLGALRGTSPLDVGGFFILKRRGSHHTISQATGLMLFGALCRWLVVGHEVPQIAELYLRLSPQGLLIHLKHFASRLALAFKLTLKFSTSSGLCHTSLDEVASLFNATSAAQKASAFRPHSHLPA